MAFFSQERKAELSPRVKEICKKYGIKASTAVDNHSTFVLNIKSGKIDFIKNANEMRKKDVYCRDDREIQDSIQVNVYHCDKHFSGKALKFLQEVLAVMNEGNFDKSDIQSDYFCVGFYVDINIGRWNKPYILTK